MNTRTIRQALLGLSMACTIAASLTACSSIDEADRLIPAENPVPVDTVTVDPNADLDSLYNLPVAEVPRRVLIEDHTGQTCVNCPDATSHIHDLQAVYPNRLVPVAIQSEYMGIMEPEGLANELGNTYFNSLNFTPKVKPAVMVSRFYNEVLTSNTDVTFYVDNVIPIPTPIDIRLKAVQDQDDATKADIDVKVVCCTPDASFAGKLQVWITEDSIVGKQDYKGGVHYDDYVHNHVLRAAVNGTWGEDVSVSGLADQREFHYTAALASNWVHKNLAIVAFVYNDEEVSQVVRQPLRTTDR